MTSLLSFAKQVSNDQFRAGAAETNISPSASLLPFMSQHESYPYVDVHDSLMARVVILEKGRERLVLAEADEVAIPEPAAWVKAIAETAKVPESNVLLTVSHTHSTLHPSSREPRLANHITWMKQQMVEAVRLALRRLVPAKIAFGRTQANANINNGELAGAKAQYDEKGFSDKTLDVIRLTTTAGDPLALIVNYSTHGEVMFRSVSNPDGYEISGDVPGRVATILQQEKNWPVVLTTPGAEGDQQPLLTSKQKTLTQGTVDEKAGGWAIVDALARRIVDATATQIDSIQDVPVDHLSAIADTVTVPGQHYNANYETGAYTLEAAPDVKIPVTDMNIGPIRIEGVGADLAARIGATLRAQSTVASTMLITNTAGSVGYILEDAAYEQPHHGAFGSHVKPGYVLPSLIKAFNR